MTPDQETLLLIKGSISDLTPEQQLQVKDCAAMIRAVIADGGVAGVVALALVGAEMQVGV